MTTILPNAAARIAQAKVLRDELTNLDNAASNPGENPNNDKTTLNLAALDNPALETPGPEQAYRLTHP